MSSVYLYYLEMEYSRYLFIFLLFRNLVFAFFFILFKGIVYPPKTLYNILHISKWHCDCINFRIKLEFFFFFRKFTTFLIILYYITFFFTDKHYIIWNEEQKCYTLWFCFAIAVASGYFFVVYYCKVPFLYWNQVLQARKRII